MIPSKLRRRLPRALALVAAGALLLPSAAAAQTWVHDDATDDVRVSSADGWADAPGHPEADIERIKVVHATRRVRVVLRIADVRKHARSVDAVIRTPPGRFRVYSYRLLDYGNEDGIVRTAKGGRKDVDCRGFRAGIEPGRDRAFLSIPRRCLGFPRWVRVGATYEDTRFIDIEAPAPAYRDDARRDGRVGGQPRLGPKVRSS